MNALFKTIGGLVRSFGVLGQIAIVCMVVTICYEVIMRYVVMSPTFWSEEVNTFLCVFVTLIPAGEVLREDSHLKIGFFVGKLGPQTQALLKRISAALGVCFCSLMVYNGINMVIKSAMYDERMSTPLGTPMFIPYLFIPAGFTALGLQFLVRMLRRPKISGGEGGALTQAAVEN